MRAIVHEEFGRPEQVLKAVEWAMPEPGPGQALVRMVLSPIHNHDIMTVSGSYGHKPRLPAVGGTEAVGVVEALGPDVTNLAVGQRIAGGAQQTWAEFYLVEAARAFPVPDAVSDETACQLVAMPLSAKMILATLDLKPGDWLVQNAGNGMVARLVSRYGAEQGIHVLSLVRRDGAVAELKAQGIETVISTEADDWPEQARRLTDGAPIRKAIDSLSGEGPSQLAEVMADGGTITSFGAMTNQPLRVPPALLLFRGMTLNGFWAARPPLAPQDIGRMLQELGQDAAAGRLALPVGGRFRLTNISDAVRASAEPGRAGKIVLEP
ncbi:alcohol dehydrogenase catalytic domain-containing protein [Rubellimicrobium arenae]|uniref:alcohol dehydrogenase catalytic domain-containing protein n=1 Tax=Rubellimicrobium arenae TaxID=2817372 RepID=UPI001B301A34|nr:zinc-binding dehydrogenase [Rubellimicrobium arenae]